MFNSEHALKQVKVKDRAATGRQRAVRKKTRKRWGTIDLYFSVKWSTGHEATNRPDWAIEVLIVAL